MAGRASIVGAAATHVGKVREHNEDAHYLDEDAGLFVVCDGMGGHAAGEVASAIAVDTVRGAWVAAEVQALVEGWVAEGTPEARRQLFGALRGGVARAHQAILAEGAADRSKQGMGTTLVAALAAGNELMFAHAGDSRAYLVRDGIAMQLTEDHTLLARLLAAGIDVDVSGEGARFRSMLTNALGIGAECKITTFAVPLADGDRFLLCSDGISEYIPEAEVGTVLTQQPSPARAAQRLVELALDRGGGDNATAVVVRVLEAGETPAPAEQRRRDDAAVDRCALWPAKLTPQQRLRALRVAIPRDHAPGARIPAHALGDRVAWIVVEGRAVQRGEELGPGALIYPDSLVAGRAAPERDALAIARTEMRVLALRADDFRELCAEDADLGEALVDAVAALLPRLPPASLPSPLPQATPPPLPVSPLRATPLPSVLAPRSVPPTPPPPPWTAGTSTPLRPAPPAPPSSPPGPRKRPSTPLMSATELAARNAKGTPSPIGTTPPPLPSPIVQRLPLQAPPDDDIEEITVSVEDDGSRITETVIETSEQTLTVTVIDHLDDGPPLARPRRASDGWDE